MQQGRAALQSLASRFQDRHPLTVSSVAGEAQEVTGVVDELVDVHVVAKHRDRTLSMPMK
jgi:hypothetical protein